MISFRTLSKSNRWLFWIEFFNKNKFALLLALALLIQAVTVGLSDDEAYYWVLGQSPAWGYAFHPPGIGWSVWIFQFLLSWAFGSNSVFLTRLPAIIFSVAAKSEFILSNLCKWRY